MRGSYVVPDDRLEIYTSDSRCSFAPHGKGRSALSVDSSKSKGAWGARTGMRLVERGTLCARLDLRTASIHLNISRPLMGVFFLLLEA